MHSIIVAQAIDATVIELNSHCDVYFGQIMAYF